MAEFVIDASMTMSWCFDDEATEDSSRVLDRMAETAAAVPALWFLEVTNVLSLCERRGRITPAQSDEFIALLQQFEIEVDDPPPARAWTHLIGLCREHNITSYDAAYIDLALRKSLPIATLDEKLRSAAKTLGITTIG